MEAIVQMVVAIFAAFVAMAAATIGLVAQLVVLLLSLLFVLLTEGLGAARKHYRNKMTIASAAEEPSGTPQESEVRQVNPKVFVTFFAIVFIGLLLGIGFWFQHYWEQMKIDATQRLLAKITTQLEEQIKAPETPNPAAGLLVERDAWEQPLECFVDETLIGTLLVVRSNGPDQHPGTLDDLHVIRTIPTTVKQFGKDVAQKAWDAAKDRVKKMLSGD